MATDFLALFSLKLAQLIPSTRHLILILVESVFIKKLIKGEDVNPDNSGLSKREWNELMIAFNLNDKII